MRLATWNVNSIRARQVRALAWVAAKQPDVLCLQEIKVETEGFPSDAFRALGYHSVVYGQKTYNGVAILSRAEPSDVVMGFGEGGGEPQARLLAATFDGIRVINAYAPNGQSVGSDKFSYKLDWFNRLRVHLDLRFDKAAPLLLCGDLNVAPEARDVYDPEGMVHEVLFHPEARAALARVVDFGLVDAFRAQRQESGLYTWWDYRQLAFPKNRGARIDHLLATPALVSRVRGASIDRDERKGKQPSDHAPVILEVEA
jgi:exodeoxyribonuclease-3